MTKCKGLLKKISVLGIIATIALSSTVSTSFAVLPRDIKEAHSKIIASPYTRITRSPESIMPRKRSAVKVGSNCSENLISNPNVSLGGKNNQMIRIKEDFYKRNARECGDYEVHSLISKAALNHFKDYVRKNKLIEFSKMDFLAKNNQDWAPSIIMEKKDVMKTRAYWAPQLSFEKRLESNRIVKEQTSELIKKGNFKEILDDEIKDIQRKFPGKYDQAIKNVQEYINRLNFRNASEFTIRFNHPDKSNEYLNYDYSKANK